MINPKITCPCCGYKTLSEERSYEICKVCYWEDDEIQFDDPTYEGGANHASLIQAQKNFLEFGACEWEMTPFVRKPLDDEPKDENWTPISS